MTMFGGPSIRSCGPYTSGSIEWSIARTRLFSPSYDLAPPHPSTVSKLDRRHTGSLRKRDNFLMVERGRGLGRRQNHTTAARNSPPLQSIQYSVMHPVFGVLSCRPNYMYRHFLQTQKTIFKKWHWKLINEKITLKNKFSNVSINVNNTLTWNNSHLIIWIWDPTWFEKQVLNFHFFGTKSWYRPEFKGFDPESIELFTEDQAFGSMRGRGWAWSWSRIIQPQESLGLYKSLNPLPFDYSVNSR